MSLKLAVIGLGNPGPRYADTRHNLGFRVVDRLAAAHGVERWPTEGSYDAATVEIAGRRVELVKPRTFINLSGSAVRAYVEDRALEPADILVVVDDTALPLGRLRLRRKGSDGGHNGLKSVIGALGTEEFPRLRVGTGPIPPRVDPVDFVLGPFAPEEKDTVEAVVEGAAECVETVVREDLERAMGAFNGRQWGGPRDGRGKRVDPAGHV